MWVLLLSVLQGVGVRCWGYGVGISEPVSARDSFMLSPLALLAVTTQVAGTLQHVAASQCACHI